jgi:antibiotic biosynthesis monooxygenase (ABM) superfamily enzyme
VIFITDFCSLEDNDSVMKKRARSNAGKNNVLGRDNGRATVIYDLELFDHMLKQLDELQQWCESLESRLWWIEEAIRLSKSGMRIKVPRWYESWLTGKIDT